MPRALATATTGKKKTDPSPYLFHPGLPLPPKSSAHTHCFQSIYDLMNASGSKFLRQLQRTINPTLSRRSLRLAYNLDAIKSKSPLDAICLPIQRRFGIGPVRMVYYRELVYGHYYQSMMEDTYLAGTSFFVVDGKRRDPDEWLTTDRFLAKTLMSLGLSWWKVEKAIADCLHQVGLPEEFKKRYGADPTGTDFIAAWEVEWSNRKTFQNYGNLSRKFSADKRRFVGQGKAAQGVEAILRGTVNDLRTEAEILLDAEKNIIIPLDEQGKLIIPSLEKDRPLNEILIPSLSPSVEATVASPGQRLSGKLMRDYGLHKILLDSRDLTQNSFEEFADYKTGRRSPLINSVIYGLGLLLWGGISANRQNMPTSPAARQLVKRKTAWLEQGEEADLQYFLPTEFYMLISDILYHCPVVRGLPDAHTIKGSIGPPENKKPLPPDPKDWPPVEPPPPMWEGLTADQVRQRFGEQHRKPKREGTDNNQNNLVL